MSIKHTIYAFLFAIFAFGNQIAHAEYTSACGGSANQPCGSCDQRSVCDNNGNCNCVTDQYCKDTNCPTGGGQSYPDGMRDRSGDTKLDIKNFTPTFNLFKSKS